MLVLILVTLILLCWGGGWGIYRSVPDRPYIGGILGILGFILLVVLIVLFMSGSTSGLR